MLIQEAQWFKEQLASMEPARVFPMCNVGSSTEVFRTQEQPWIDELIFAPIVRQGHVVKHLDMKSAPGVDIVGDIGSPDFLKQVANMRFKSFFCSNLLEHLVNREEICRALLHMIPSGGYFFMSAPQFYPYHPDPIDTGFRPSILELAALFPGTYLAKSCVVTGSTLLGIRRRDPLVLAFTLLRFLFPMYKPVSWWRNRGYLPYFFRRLMATCVVLQKE
jgi:hypothetical protein